MEARVNIGGRENSLSEKREKREKKAKGVGIYAVVCVGWVILVLCIDMQLHQVVVGIDGN